MSRIIDDFKDAVVVANIIRRAAKSPGAKDVAEATKLAGQAERAYNKVEKLLSGRSVLLDDVDTPLGQLHDLYNKVKGLAEKCVDRAEAYLKEHSDDTQNRRWLAHDLDLLKDNMSRRKGLATGSAPSARDLYTNEGLGDGPMRKSQYHKIRDLARNLNGGCSSYASAMKDLEEYMSK